MRAIATIASPVSGEIVVYRHRASGLTLYTQGGYEQSAADQNGVSTASYIHALYGLVRQTRSQDVLIVGCGGGSLARMLVRAGARVAMVDLDPASFELARNYFSLPEACVCHVGDGREFLTGNARRYDAIVLDAYTAGEMPAHLADRAFFALVKRRLNAKGAFFVNAFVRGPEDTFARDIAAHLRQVWRHVRVLEMTTRVNRNAIVMAGAVESLAQPTLIEAPEIEREDIEDDLRGMTFA
jgi:spermidine synthase